MKPMLPIFAAVLLAACGQGEMTDEPRAGEEILVRSQAQKQLQQMDDLTRAISLKRAIRDSGSSCLRITQSAYVGRYENLDYYAATCEDEYDRTRDWALFIGADDSVQVRLCEDVAKVGLPACEFSTGEQGEGEAAPEPSASDTAG